MRIVILGGGVVGVTSAYYLTLAGHDVEVLDRQPGPALETSFANAGEVSPGYAAPWAGPGVPLKALKWLATRHSPLAIRPRADWAMLRWIVAMLRNCTAERYAVNKARMVRLAEYSRDCLKALRQETGIRYDERALGTLQLFRSTRQVDDAVKDVAVLRDSGVAFETLDVDGCVRAEPGLAFARDKIAGGLRLPGDETGDCQLFTERLAVLTATMGAAFRYGVRFEKFQTDGGRISGAVTDHGLAVGDAYVVALGPYSPLALRPLGIDIPVYPVKGYSLTAPIVDADDAPVSTVLDETYKVATTRLGDRIRIGGMAELTGYDLTLRQRRRETLLRSAGDLFPRGGDLSRASFWCGLRPMTPDGTPILGPAPYPNLFLNTGHGTLGWTMACGSGRALADVISGRKPDVSLDGLTLARYG